MKKASAIKGFFILLAVFLTGITWTACDDKPEDTATQDPNNPIIAYTKVVAWTYDQLVGYLSSDSTPYEISLNLEGKDIYLQKNITVTQNMKLIGSPNNIFTIHSVNENKGDNFYCLYLQENLELQYCEFIGYDTTSASAGGISAGSPPLMVRSGKTLSLGKDAALVFNPSPTCTYNATYSGGTVAVNEGGSFRNAWGLATFFGTGVTSLTVSKDGAAELGQGLANIGGVNPTFEVESGSFGIEISKNGIAYVANGNVSLRRDWTLENGQSLHIKSGELGVRNSVVLIKIEELFEGLILDGNIRFDDNTKLEIFANPFPKLSGSGAIIIDYTSRTLPVVSMHPDPLNPSYEAILGLKPQANGRLEISAAGWKVTRISADSPAMAELGTYGQIVSDGLTMLVDSGVTLNVKENLSVERGGIIDVKGAVNVGTGGRIFITDGPAAGSARIEGSVTVDDGGVFHDATVEYKDAFVFPSYDGGGSLIIKNTTGTAGTAIIGQSTQQTIVGNTTSTDLLVLEKDAVLEMGRRNSQTSYELTGEATLTLPGDIELIGEFTVNAGPSSTFQTILNVDAGGNDLTINDPSSLLGPSGTVTYPPKIVLSGAGSITMNKPPASPPPSPPYHYFLDTDDTYTWVSQPDYWLP